MGSTIVESHGTATLLTPPPTTVPPPTEPGTPAHLIQARAQPLSTDRAYICGI